VKGFNYVPPDFSLAHFGIVGDYKEVVLALTAKLKELKSK